MSSLITRNNKKSITEEFVQLLTNFNYDELDQVTINQTKKCFLDFIGVAIAGSKEDSSIIWSKLLQEHTSKNEYATILDGSFRKERPDLVAALNAVMGHSQDLDDLHSKSITHPGVITIPTALALGQKNKSSGKDLIKAIVLGYETAARIGEVINPSSYWFWHTTGLVGSLSSTVVAGILQNFSEHELTNALGNAGSQAAGLWQFMDNGSMTKTLHVAKANMNGILTADLTKLGFTGAIDILGGEKGLIKAVAPKYDMGLLIKSFGKPYKINEVSLKPFPCCRHTHSAITAIINLKEKYDIPINNIDNIVDYTYGTALAITDNPNPTTEYAHKFSLQFIIASALINGNISQDSFSKKNIEKVKATNIMNRISVKQSPVLEKNYQIHKDQWTHRLVITLLNGDSFEEEVIYPKGDSNNPLSWEEVVDKTKSITDGIVSPSNIEELVNRITFLEELKDINDLFVFN